MKSQQQQQQHEADVHTNLALASRHFSALLRVAIAADAVFLLLWIGAALLPLVVFHHVERFASPMSAVVYAMLVAVAWLGLIAVRLSLVLFGLPRADKVRVDYMANSPSLLRQGAYLAYYPSLALWWWLGVFGAPLLGALTAVVILTRHVLQLDGSQWLVCVAHLLLALLSGIVEHKTSVWLYVRGVHDASHRFVTATDASATAWALVRAREMRTALNGEVY